MKNIKKTIFIFFLFISANLIAYANSNFSLNLTANAGLMNGTIKEFVFAKNSTNTDNVLSRLDWDIKNIPVCNIQGKVDIFKYSFVKTTGFFGIPKSSGVMQDYDWMFYSPELTNYSYHNNYLSSYYGITIAAGANFFIPIINLRLSPFVAYQYEYLGMNGSDGYRQYKNENWEKKEFSGKIISYFHEINSFLLGLDFEVPVFSLFGISGSFSISPNATFIQALDFHYINRHSYGTVYLDTLNNAFQLQADATIYANINRHNKLSVSCFVQYIPTAKGNDYYKFITTDGIYINPDDKWIQTGTNNAGTSRFLYKINLGYTYSF